MEKNSDSKTVFMNSFKELLNAKPCSKISVSDLVNDSKLSRQTFYRNFSGIDELIYSIHYQNVSVFFDLVTKIGYNQSIYTVYLDLMHNNKKFYQRIISFDDNNPFVKLYYQKTKDNMINYIFREYKDKFLEDEILMSALDFHVYGSASMILTWIKSNNPCTTEYLATVIHRCMPTDLKQLTY